MSLQAEALSAANDEECNDFLDRLGRENPSVLAYHYPGYRDMLVKIGVGQPFYLGARLGGDLVGLLPGFLREGEAGDVYSSLPYFGPNGGVICAMDERAPAIHQVLLGSVLDHMRSRPRALAASFCTPFLFQQFDYYDGLNPRPVVVPRFTQYLELSEAEWGSTRSRGLRKAAQQGIEISSGFSQERLDDLFAIYQENCQAYGIPPKPRAAIQALFQAPGFAEHVSCYFAFHGRSMIAGLIVLFAPLTVSYYLPCTAYAARSLHPSLLLVDHAVNHARRRGIRFWNWESSPSRDSGVYQFKKTWGSRESEYRIYVIPFRPREEYHHLGQRRLASEFPYFFVYPYDQI